MTSPEPTSSYTRVKAFVLPYPPSLSRNCFPLGTHVRPAFPFGSEIFAIIRFSISAGLKPRVGPRGDYRADVWLLASVTLLLHTSSLVTTLSLAASLPLTDSLPPVTILPLMDSL